MTQIRSNPLAPKTTFHGFIDTTADALLLFEACRLGRLQLAPTQRLEKVERDAISSGDCFVYCEETTRIHRWSDGRRWSANRVRGSFLIYREVDSRLVASTKEVSAASMVRMAQRSVRNRRNNKQVSNSAESTLESVGHRESNSLIVNAFNASPADPLWCSMEQEDDFDVRTTSHKRPSRAICYVLPGGLFKKTTRMTMDG
eukprot:jgi/Hompol1/6211/HPOL_004903-RA